MVGGRTLSQAIPILLTPLLTRIYSPGEFGIFAAYSTIVSIVSLISSGRYCLAILLPSEEEKSKYLVFTSSLLTIIVSTVFSLFLFLYGDIFFNILNIEILKKYIIILPLNILFVGLYESLFYYVLRTKNYKFFSLNVIIQALVLIATRLSFGFLGFTEIGLIISYLISYAISYAILFIKLNVLKFFIISIKNIKYIKSLLFEYIKFPKYSLFSDTLAMFTNSAPNMLINNIFGNTSAGYYSLTETILDAPIWFITSSVGDVFRQEASEQYRKNGTCLNVFNKTAKSLFLLGSIPFILIFLIVPFLVPYIFGEEWEPTGNFIRIFSIMYYAKFVVTPISYVNYIIDKQRYYVFFQVIKFLSIAIGFTIGYVTNDLYLGSISWSILLTTSYFVIFFISRNLVRNL